MGGRYYITGIQLGYLLHCVHINERDKIEKVLVEISKNQFIGGKKYLKKLMKKKG